ncbi:hypothetical protein F2Q69_00039098 [Brassica cretica]|uniref:Uncharacterized protein n=1 Tax=Brassica cretica TaxID=69181 RepID=A0A8S9SV32_BRACR|nr:hypothetical protein F2Q69_00039098 [Brassica cretica]
MAAFDFVAIPVSAPYVTFRNLSISDGFHFILWFTHLFGSFPWARLGSGPLHPEGLYLGWGQGPTPNTAFGDRVGSSPPPGVKFVSMTIGPQGPYEVSYLVP